MSKLQSISNPSILKLGSTKECRSDTAQAVSTSTADGQHGNALDIATGKRTQSRFGAGICTGQGGLSVLWQMQIMDAQLYPKGKPCESFTDVNKDATEYP